MPVSCAARPDRRLPCPRRVPLRISRLARIAPLACSAGIALGLFLGLAGSAQAQTVATPFTQTGVPLASLASEVVYTVDLETLPGRPRMLVEATPDASHPDMELELEVLNCTLENPVTSFFCPASTVSTPNEGPQSVEYVPWRCEVATTVPAYVGETCEVRIRALDFGSAGAPATFDVTIRGESMPPTSTVEVEVTASVQSATISAAKDTTLYQANPGASNGLGESFWTAVATASNARHGLAAFNVQASVPAGATILDAWLELTVLARTGTPGFAVHAVPRHPSILWTEGNANAAGDESSPPTPLGGAATWSHRNWFSAGAQGPWTTAGGDRDPAPLATASPTQDGLLTIASAALLDHVRAIYASTASYDGLLLVPTTGSVRIASAEHLTVASRPRLVVQYAAPTAPIEDFIPTTTTEYFNEGQNFRWIYDLDADNVLLTPVDGRCEWTPPGGFLINIPYTYQYLGSPTYQGLDCCSWQMGSTTGVTGAGQAIFYINLDSSNPANQPGDLDLDGLKDLCDNCPTVPNGPLRGTCTTGPSTGSTCRSNQECGSGQTCSLAQDDADLDGDGDACVPEPELGGLLAAGLSALAGLARNRGRARGLRA